MTHESGPRSGPAPARPGTGRSARWTAGVAAVMALLVLGVGGCALGADDGTEQPAGDEPGEGEFVPVGALCTDVDYSPVFDLVPLSPSEYREESRPAGSSDLASCIFGDATSGFGLLEAHASISPAPELASSVYQGIAGQTVGARSLPADVAGRWDEGVMSGSTTPTTDAEVIVLDGVLMLNLRLATPAQGTASDLADHQSALLEVAENMREAMRRPG